MSDIPGRLYQIAKAYLDAAKGRLEEIDAQAQAELSRSQPRDFIPDPPPMSSDDPMARAQAKIDAARQRLAARGELTPPDNIAPVPAVSAVPMDPVQTAYKIIGVPIGSDYVTVQQAVSKLRERCSPTRFPSGSQEQSEALEILKRVEEAFHVLKNALDATEGRFDRLEI